jgi:hypothetical protein
VVTLSEINWKLDSKVSGVFARASFDLCLLHMCCLVLLNDQRNGALTKPRHHNRAVGSIFHCLWGYLIDKLHKGEVHVPKETEHSDIEWLQLGWNEGEVDELKDGPYFVVGLQGWNHLTVELIVAFLDALALEQRQGGIEGADGDKSEDGLGEEHLLGDG